MTNFIVSQTLDREEVEEEEENLLTKRFFNIAKEKKFNSNKRKIFSLIFFLPSLSIVIIVKTFKIQLKLLFYNEELYKIMQIFGSFCKNCK